MVSLYVCVGDFNCNQYKKLKIYYGNSGNRLSSRYSKFSIL